MNSKPNYESYPTVNHWIWHLDGVKCVTVVDKKGNTIIMTTLNTLPRPLSTFYVAKATPELISEAHKEFIASWNPSQEPPRAPTRGFIGWVRGKLGLDK